MEKYFVCFLLCIIQRPLVNGQDLVSYKDGVIVSSSSQYDDKERFDIEHALDGNASTNAATCSCCAATNPDLNPWYKVDLRQTYMIHRIHILGRTDSYHNLYKMEIRLGTTESNGTILPGVNTSDTNINELDFTMTPPEPARYITLTLRNRTEYFVICELYVYAACSGGLYGPDCANKCGQCQDDESCNGVTGECPLCTAGYQSPMCKNCIAGYYGYTCEECGQCFNNFSCDKSDGSCPNGCSFGYNGSTCKQVCTGGTYGQNCVNTCGNCKNNEPCDSLTGACLACITGYESPLCNVCIDGRFGTTCNEICGHCNGINGVCDTTNGSCPSGCSAGYQGITCTKVCDWGTYGMGCTGTCGKCENNATCNSVVGLCTDCVTGYLSPKCKVCSDGRYGTTCYEECGYCNNNATCDKQNGYCPYGCSAGYQGNTCKKVCNPGTYGINCANTCGRCKNNATCNNVDGTCTACSTGYGLPMCKDCDDGRSGVTCTETCGHCNNTDACDKTNANCPNGCSAGYQGVKCKEECEDGTFGLNCEEKCGNCFNCGSCNKVDGRCASCAAGYTGNTCVDECQAGTYGFNCKQRCGMCQDGDVCDKYTGDCPNGCIDGYKASQCSQEIIQNDRCSSETSISLPVFIGSLFAVVIVNTTIVLGLVWLLYRKRMNQKAHKPENHEDTSLPLPNTTSNYDTLRFDNPDRESTYTELNRRS